MRHLNQGIRITEFDAVKAQIMANDTLRTYYYGCVSFYITFIDQRKNVSPSELNISGVESYNQK